MGFGSFLQDVGNLATGGLLGQATGRTKDLQDQKIKDMEAMISDPAKLKEAASYEQGLGARLGNLLTGGLYGEFSGDNQKMRDVNMINQAKNQVRQDQIMEQLYNKMAELAPQPQGTDVWSK